MRKNQSHGFTLVETAIVIAVISILAAITLVIYNTVQAQTRDSRRTADIRLIMSALDKYHGTANEYPPCPGIGDGAACGIDALAPVLVPNYLTTMPVDPAGQSSYYQYVRNGSDAYGLEITHYEKTPVCKTGDGVTTSNWTTSIPICTNFS